MLAQGVRTGPAGPVVVLTGQVVDDDAVAVVVELLKGRAALQAVASERRLVSRFGRCDLGAQQGNVLDAVDVEVAVEDGAELDDLRLALLFDGRERARRRTVDGPGLRGLEVVPRVELLVVVHREIAAVDARTATHAAVNEQLRSCEHKARTPPSLTRPPVRPPVEMRMGGARIAAEHREAAERCSRRRVSATGYASCIRAIRLAATELGRIRGAVGVH